MRLSFNQLDTFLKGRVGLRIRMRIRKNNLTLKELKRILKYNPRTGQFIWNKKLSFRIWPGKVAGCIGVQGYRYIGIKNISYRAHRLAWFYMTGKWPRDFLDHVNGVRSDNRFSNLRLSNNRQNSINKKQHREGKLPGCSFIKRKNKWQAAFKFKGKRYFIGLFKTEVDASLAYFKKLKEFGVKL